ncbi:MAG: hypothetical protein GX021_00200 [Tissierellia bacterium]|nr:hypothetical protein [Tissierellia bacterium]
MREKNIDELVDKIKEYNPSEEDVEKIQELAEIYQDKSEDDIFIEIIRVNETLEKQLTEEEYREIFEKLESIRPLLSEEQNRKLDRILDLLNNE